jgi:hypothetical protein
MYILGCTAQTRISRYTTKFPHIPRHNWGTYYIFGVFLSPVGPYLGTEAVSRRPVTAETPVQF